MNSMTGFGRSEGKIDNAWYTIEVKSVNHRYLDSRIRLPSALSSLEPKLQSSLRNRFTRGSFEVSVRQKQTAEQPATGNTNFIIDISAARSFAAGCEQLTKELSVPLPVTLEALISTNKVFIPTELGAAAENLSDEVEKLFSNALSDLEQMRANEGAGLQTILSDAIKYVTDLSHQLREKSVDQPKLIREKLTKRIEKYQMASSADPQRLEWEVAYFAERSDITEEIDRLQNHLQSFTQLLSSKEPVGRKLDFLTQEMHREVNTTGAKAGSIELTQLTVEAKTAIEKLREQVQNVE